MLPTQIVFNGRPAEVREGALVVTLAGPHVNNPTQDEAEKVKVYIARLADPGGSTSLAIDGSVDPVVFSVGASQTELIRVEEIRLIFHSVNMDMDSAQQSRRFGPVVAPGLANGLTLTYRQAGEDTQAFIAPVVVIGDFLRAAGGPQLGALDAITNLPDAIANNVDFLMVQMIPPVAIVLYPGSKDSVFVTVSDGLEGIDLFEVQVNGTREPA